ncbi:hypothetical protein D3C85_1442790 [compost metagenome]
MYNRPRATLCIACSSSSSSACLSSKPRTPSLCKLRRVTGEVSMVITTMAMAGYCRRSKPTMVRPSACWPWGMLKSVTRRSQGCCCSTRCRWSVLWALATTSNLSRAWLASSWLAAQVMTGWSSAMITR